MAPILETQWSQVTAVLDAPLLEGVFRQLRRARDASQLNPAIEPATERAYNVARELIILESRSFPSLPTPRVIVPGDGGIVVEWVIGGDLVSVNFDSHDAEMDTVFSKLKDRTQSADINENTLDELLSKLAGDTTPPLSSGKIQEINTGPGWSSTDYVPRPFVGAATAANPA